MDVQDYVERAREKLDSLGDRHLSTPTEEIQEAQVYALLAITEAIKRNTESCK
jgi:hypothetical protein